MGIQKGFGTTFHTKPGIVFLGNPLDGTLEHVSIRWGKGGGVREHVRTRNAELLKSATATCPTSNRQNATLEATQRQMNGSFVQLPYIFHLEKVEFVGD